MFITIEGTEGVGKTTLIKGLEKYFLNSGREVQLTREPGGTLLAEKIREILIDPNVSEKIAPETELLLMYAARVQNVNNNIIPALRSQKVLINDRHFDSSFSYQVHARGLSRDIFYMMQENFITIIPDITFWLDMPVEIGMKRAQKRGELDRFEKEKMSFFSKVRDGYAILHKQHPNRIKRINADQSAEEVLRDAIKHIRSMPTKPSYSIEG